MTSFRSRIRSSPWRKIPAASSAQSPALGRRPPTAPRGRRDRSADHQALVAGHFAERQTHDDRDSIRTTVMNDELVTIRHDRELRCRNGTGDDVYPGPRTTFSKWHHARTVCLQGWRPGLCPSRNREVCDKTRAPALSREWTISTNSAMARPWRLAYPGFGNARHSIHHAAQTLGKQPPAN